MKKYVMNEADRSAIMCTIDALNSHVLKDEQEPGLTERQIRNRVRHNERFLIWRFLVARRFESAAVEE